jgi:hypothetical protein
MSYNPVAAANFYKSNKHKRPRVQNPHAGVKHSDIMRRQGGIGSALPQQRTVTASGYSSAIFKGTGFNFRHELLAAGNSSGLGVNAEKARVFHVVKGVLFFLVHDAEGNKSYVQVQEGGNFVAQPGLIHGYATTGTQECAFLIAEDADYASTWEELEAGNAKAYQHALEGGAAPEPEPYQLGTNPQAQAEGTQRRRSNQAKAKDQAVRQAMQKNRRKPKGVKVTPGAPSQAGQTITGATRVGYNASENPNSGNVDGVNPMPIPMGRE